MIQFAGALKAAQRQAPPQGSLAPAPKAPLVFTQWGLPQAAPSAGPSRAKTQGAALSGPATAAASADKKKSGQGGSFPPMPTNAQQQVDSIY